MPYEKGHKYHAPKARRMNVRHLLKSVQDKISADMLVDFHLAVASNKDPYVAVDDDGDPYIACKDHGFEPTLEQRVASIDWLAVRGWGQPAQMHIIEQFNRQDNDDKASDFAALSRSPAAVRALRAGIEAAMSLMKSVPVAGPLELAEKTEVEDAATDESSDE